MPPSVAYRRLAAACLVSAAGAALAGPCWAVMVRKNGALHDGWHWTIYFRLEFRSMETMGTFAYSFCYTCHASARSESTFASARNLRGENAASVDGCSYSPAAGPNFLDDVRPAPPPPSPRATINPAFKALYDDPAIYPRGAVPRYEPEVAGVPLPDTDFDHVWSRARRPTSRTCACPATARWASGNWSRTSRGASSSSPRCSRPRARTRTTRRSRARSRCRRVPRRGGTRCSA